MITVNEYSLADCHKGKCKSCGDRAWILNHEVWSDGEFDDICLDCIESIKFEEATSK